MSNRRFVLADDGEDVVEVDVVITDNVVKFDENDEEMETPMVEFTVSGVPVLTLFGDGEAQVDWYELERLGFFTDGCIV